MEQLIKCILGINSDPEICQKLDLFLNTYYQYFYLFEELRENMNRKNFELEKYVKNIVFIKHDLKNLKVEIIEHFSKYDNEFVLRKVKEFDELFNLNYLIVEVNGDLIIQKLAKCEKLNRKIENFTTLFNIIKYANVV